MNPPKEWPTHGKLEFHKVQLRYRKDLPFILKDISFTAKPGEHIGKSGARNIFATNNHCLRDVTN